MFNDRIDYEGRIPLAEAVEFLPKTNGKPLCSKTLYKWVSKGVRGVSGSKVKLRAERIGGRYFTSRLWIDDFIKACSQPVAEEFPARRNGKSYAERKLISMGFHGAEARKELMGE